MEKEQLINYIMLGFSAAAFIVFLTSFIYLSGLSTNLDNTLAGILSWINTLLGVKTG